MTVASDPILTEPLTPQRASKLANLGLAMFFTTAARAPAVVRLFRKPSVFATLACSSATRLALAQNGKRILGADVTPERSRRYARQLIANFFDFVVDVVQSSNLSVAQVHERICEVQNEPRYLQCRAKRCGAILVTAHMGSFEAGLAALRKVEPRIHVVFKRDTFGRFEQIRRRLRHSFEIIEAPIDDGWPTLVKLRDALLNNEVIAMQADRAIPGQRSLVVPFLHGHLRLPMGPVKLAQLTGAPIVPVFSTRCADGRFRVHLEAPIWVERDDTDAAMGKIAAVLAAYVSRFPEQWLVLHRAFEEDVAVGDAVVER